MTTTVPAAGTTPFPIKHAADGGALLALDHSEHLLSTLVGQSAIHSGDIYLTGNEGILIRGTLIGRIFSAGAVVIDKGANVFGEIHASYLHCAGKIAGAVEGKPAPEKPAIVQVEQSASFYEGTELHASVRYGEEAPVLSRGVKMTGRCEYEEMEAAQRDKMKQDRETFLQSIGAVGRARPATGTAPNQGATVSKIHPPAGQQPSALPSASPAPASAA